ncbi:putative ankyrin repeat protein [Cotonvirus japonicus]|uniref:Ankyrin repeat protein n=1 Tax=Cotonvirus japonicus TaxID=2811091 RepID=A0ABM7NTB0_9VIRU|nr:putative ankyrin repeat protein [Cotonvirus japonicus]BCS83412.1 putative ankyrin repeat protein [Cotonvirus japonicus]
MITEFEYTEYYDFESEHNYSSCKFNGISDDIYINCRASVKTENLNHSETIQYLKSCIMLRKSDLFVKIFEQYSDIDASEDNNIFLKIAITYGDILIVRFLIEKGCDVLMNNNIAIKIAAGHFSIEIIELLVKSGADPCTDNDFPLRYAAFHERNKSVDLFIKYGANIYANNNFIFKHYMSLVDPDDYFACHFKDNSLIRILIDKGLDVNAENGLLLTTFLTDYKTSKILLKMGADVTYLSDTNLFSIIMTGKNKLINLFTKYGVNFSRLNNLVPIKSLDIDSLIHQGVDISNLLLLVLTQAINN